MCDSSNSRYMMMVSNDEQTRAMQNRDLRSTPLTTPNLAGASLLTTSSTLGQGTGILPAAPSATMVAPMNAASILGQALASAMGGGVTPGLIEAASIMGSMNATSVLSSTLPSAMDSGLTAGLIPGLALGWAPGQMFSLAHGLAPAPNLLSSTQIAANRAGLQLIERQQEQARIQLMQQQQRQIVQQQQMVLFLREQRLGLEQQTLQRKLQHESSAPPTNILPSGLRILPLLPDQPEFQPKVISRHQWPSPTSWPAKETQQPSLTEQQQLKNSSSRTEQQQLSLLQHRQRASQLQNKTQQQLSLLQQSLRPPRKKLVVGQQVVVVTSTKLDATSTRDTPVVALPVAKKAKVEGASFTVVTAAKPFVQDPKAVIAVPKVASATSAFSCPPQREEHNT